MLHVPSALTFRHVHLPTRSIYLFRMLLKRGNNHFHKQGLRNGEAFRLP